MSDGPLDEAPTPAEQRLAALLALLRSDMIRSRPALVEHIMRRVRWQGLVREALEAVEIFASTVGRGLALLLARSPSRREDQ